MPTYTDTGLGWYAYEDWVRQETGLLGTLSSGGGSFKCYDPTKGQSFLLGNIVYHDSGLPKYSNITILPETTCYVACGSDQAQATSDYYAELLLFAPQAGTYRLRYSRIVSNGVQEIIDTNIRLGSAETYSIYTVYNNYGGWYPNTTWIGNTTPLCVPQSRYNDPNTVAYAAYVSGAVSDTSFYKFLPGYCVACIAEWGVRGESGSYIGPILASTESQYIALSIDNTEAYSGHVWYEDLPAPGERVYFQAIRDFSLPDYQTVIEDLTVPYVNLGIEEISDTQIAFQILEKSGWHWGSYEDADPYADGGESEAGGGDGTFDFSSTEIPYGGLPTIGAFATGMVDVYMPTRAELVSLSQYLWAGAFDVDNFKKVVADPMDVIIGLHIIPLTKAQVGVTSSTLVVGNISTGISMDRASKQYVLFDMGSIEILPKWGAYLDFSPYSKLTLFLPYIGYVDISPDDCMDGTIGVQYYIDIISGICVAQVKCNDHVLYQFSGNCSCQLPITAGQYQNIAIAGMNILGAALGSASSMIMPKGGGDTGDKLGAVSGAVNLLVPMVSEGLSMFKPSVQRSGGFGSSSGLMGIQTPYLVLTVPRMCIPGEQNKYIGYPSFVTKVMSTLSGFNSVQVTHLNNMSCTAEEADEIIALLSQGVIF